jgi:hypothetical protein
MEGMLAVRLCAAGERDWSTLSARRRRPRGVGSRRRCQASDNGVALSESLEEDLEAVKDYSERGAALGLGPWVRRLERLRKGEAAGSQWLMADGEGCSRRFRDRPPWIREGSSSRGAGDERGI